MSKYLPDENSDLIPVPWWTDAVAVLLGLVVVAFLAAMTVRDAMDRSALHPVCVAEGVRGAECGLLLGEGV